MHLKMSLHYLRKAVVFSYNSVKTDRQTNSKLNMLHYHGGDKNEWRCVYCRHDNHINVAHNGTVMLQYIL